MKIMLIAGEVSGDKLAAELVGELRKLMVCESSSLSFAPTFFGAGGSEMAKAGVEVVEDMTLHSAVGLSEVVKKYPEFRKIFGKLLQVACARQPDLVICVDFSGFNLRFVKALRRQVRKMQGAFVTWNPKIIQFVSPQVWASRAERARGMERDLDLLLSIFPFEKDWYAKHAPGLKVEFVGHPMMDRHQKVLETLAAFRGSNGKEPRVLLLPGSRKDEIRRHLPVMLEAAQRIRNVVPCTFCMVMTNNAMEETARPLVAGAGVPVEMVVGGLAETMARSTMAIACTGTVTMECALFGLPAVTLYKTSWLTYLIGRQIVKVKYLSMPNILADGPLYPEYLQNAATSGNISDAAISLLNSQRDRDVVKAKLGEIVASLGGPGAARRAAKAVVRMLGTSSCLSKTVE